MDRKRSRTFLHPGAIEDVNDAPYVIVVQSLDHLYEPNTDFSPPFHVINAKLNKGGGQDDEGRLQNIKVMNDSGTTCPPPPSSIFLLPNSSREAP